MSNKSSQPLTPVKSSEWVDKFTKIVEAHFQTAESRIDLFIQQELKSPSRIFLRNFKYTALDFFIIIYNIVGMLLNLITRKTLLVKKESLTEKSTRAKFDEIVFHSTVLDQKIQKFFHELDDYILETIKEQVSQLKGKQIDPKTYRSILKGAIKQTTTFPDITKLIIVESAIPIFCSYYFANKVTKGFGPVGAIAARTFYWKQVSWWEKPLYWSFWSWIGIAPKEIPLYITMVGSVAGFAAGLVLVAPLLNAIVELVISYLVNPKKRIIKQLTESRKKLLYAGKQKRRKGAVGLVFERLNILGEAMDYVKDMFFMLR